VLAVALHESLHHAEPHDHDAALQAALHGHAHEGTPDHDHEIAMAPSAPRPGPLGCGMLAAALAQRPAQVWEVERTGLPGISTPRERHHGPPPYLALGALLI
jgi:hypothetical protein